MASRNRDDPSSRGAARSLRRAATWRSQAYVRSDGEIATLRSQ
ncbi:MAG TPA: hypothetical protein PLG59_12875 [bacterium]|nr:hypothetical protein [bacterium]